VTALATLARMLGVRCDLAEDALHSERAAKAVLSRRSLFAVGAAMATGSVFSFGTSTRLALPDEFFDLCARWSGVVDRHMRKDWSTFVIQAVGTVRVSSVSFAER